jgi:hypothetical protein
MNVLLLLVLFEGLANRAKISFDLFLLILAEVIQSAGVILQIAA